MLFDMYRSIHVEREVIWCSLICIGQISSTGVWYTAMAVSADIVVVGSLSLGFGPTSNSTAKSGTVMGTVKESHCGRERLTERETREGGV